MLGKTIEISIYGIVNVFVGMRKLLYQITYQVENQRAAGVVYDNNNIKDLDISFKYNSILPDSVSDMINMLAVAVGAGITSRENAVRILTINGPETLEEIYKEKLEEAIVANAKAASANVKLDGVENNRNEEGIN